MAYLVRPFAIIALCLFASYADAGFAIFQITSNCGSDALLVTSVTDCSNVLTGGADRLLAN